MSEPLKLTTRGRYAVMAMVELAKSEPGDPIPLADIADKANISLSYLEQLIAGLRRKNLVKSYRGPGGGYILANPVSEIRVSDILIAAEDSTPAKRQGKNGAAAGAKDIACEHTFELWSQIGTLLYAALQKVSLQDVIDRRVDGELQYQ